MFNKPTFGTTFGASQPASSLFGQKSALTFGQPQQQQQQQTSSLFGAQPTAVAGSSLFGSTAAQPVAGAAGGLFGSTAAKPSLFGTSATSSVFGAGAPTQNASLFSGTAQQQTTPSLFGASTLAAPMASGTTIKFDAPISTDTMLRNGASTNIQTKHMCISAMKHYEAKALEELRVDDYIANRKVPTTAAATTSIFGQPQQQQQTSSLFGSPAQKPATGGLFGTTATAGTAFGAAPAAATSLFGSPQQPAQQTSSLFGAKPATTGLFGQSTSAAFGQPQQPAQQTTLGLFGSAAQPAVAAAAPAATGAFNFGSAVQTAGTSLFGNTAATAAPAGSLFGSAPQAGTSLFGAKPAAGLSLFGSNTGTAVAAQPAAGTSLFGAAKPAGGLFGSTTTTTGGSLFGAAAQQPGTGLFGAQAAAPVAGSLFGQPATAQQTALLAGTPAVAAAPIVLGSDVNGMALQSALLKAQLASSPYGDEPLLKFANKERDTDEKPNPINLQRQQRFLNAKLSVLNAPLETSVSSSAESVKVASPLGGSFVRRVLPPIGAPLDDLYATDSRANVSSAAVLGDLSYTPNAQRRSTATSPARAMSAARTDLQSRDINDLVDTAVGVPQSKLKAPTSSLRSSSTHVKHLDLDAADRRRSDVRKDSDTSAAQSRVDAIRPPNFDQTVDLEDSIAVTAAAAPQPVAKDQSTTPRALPTPSPPPVASPKSPAKSPDVASSAGVTCAASDYELTPSIELMRSLVRDGHVVLPNGLCITRPGFGSIFWPGELKIKDIAIDEVVNFSVKEVTVYPNESEKPPVGEGLNRVAEVTLEKCYPLDKETKFPIKDPIVLEQVGWRDRLERLTARMQAKFLDFRPESGSWVFRVDHF